MQHFGDLQPLGQQDIVTDQVPHRRRYTVSRSRWRFAMGRVEIGFHREHEEISADNRPVHARITPDQLPGRRIAERPVGERFMMVLGTATALLLVTGVTGLIWTMRSGATVGRGEISTAIHDITPPPSVSATAGDRAPFVIPARHRPRDLHAVIEQAKPGPTSASADALPSPIAFAAMAMEAPPPSSALIRSGNFAAIPQVASAMDAAMAEGDAQNWSAGGYHGIVVVGNAGADTCRDGTILLRDGSRDGRTQTFRRCAK